MALGAAELALLESAVAENPGSRLFMRLAQAYLDAGRLGQARKTLEQGLALHPDEVEGLRLLAQVLHGQGEDSLALVQLHRAVAVMSRHAGLYNDLAELLSGQGRGQEARQARRLAQDLTLDLASASAQPAPSADQLGEDALSQDTPTLAEIYAAQGLNDRAAEIYRRLLAAEPGNPQLARRLAQLEGWPPQASQAAPASQADILGHLEALQGAALARAGGGQPRAGSDLLAGLEALKNAALARAGGGDQQSLLARLEALQSSALARAAAGA
jgi:Tfp pilus assembly protein PilF